AQVVAPGGSIFIGDVRSLPLLEALHTSAELHRAPDTLSTEQLRQRVQKRLAHEQELVIDPTFFTALKRHLPKISRVRLEPKRGRHHNELTRFRYDVTLQLGLESDGLTDHTWLDWQQQRLSLSALRRMLEEDAPEALALRRVPNTRVLKDLKTLELLSAF